MMSVPGWNLSSQNMIQIKEIRLINKGDRTSYDGYTYLPKMFAVINRLPGETLRNFLCRTLLFYRSPYEKYKYGWELSVSGIAYTGQTKVNFQGGIPDIKIYADGEQVYTHMFQEEPGSNLVYFTVGASKVNPKFRSLKIDFNIAGKLVSRTYSTNFDTKTYGYFSRMPGYYDNFSPEKLILDKLWTIQKGGSPDSSIMQSTDLYKRLNWVRNKDVLINQEKGYLEKYKNHKCVYTVTLKYALDKRNYNKFTGQQIFYLIRDNDKWVIIDVTPFTEI